MEVSAHRAFALLKELAYERVSCSAAVVKHCKMQSSPTMISNVSTLMLWILKH